MSFSCSGITDCDCPMCSENAHNLTLELNVEAVETINAIFGIKAPYMVEIVCTCSDCEDSSTSSEWTGSSAGVSIYIDDAPRKTFGYYVLKALKFILSIKNGKLMISMPTPQAPSTQATA